MNSRLRVYPDTNVCIPYYQSDLLFYLAAEGFFHVLWTDYLRNEVIRVVARRAQKVGHDRSVQAARSQWTAIAQYFAHYRIDPRDYAPWLESLTGPDPDDHPHAAAAICGHADALLTQDIRGFPVWDLAPHGIQVQSLDTFLVAMCAGLMGEVRQVLKRRAAQFLRPEMSYQRYVQVLRQTLPGFGDQILGGGEGLKV